MIVQQITSNFLFVFLVSFILLCNNFPTNTAQQTSSFQKLNCIRSPTPPNLLFRSYLSFMAAILQDKSQHTAFYFHHDLAETVFYSYLCRGDINGTRCSDCIVEAAKTAVQSCNLTSKEAIIWKDECMFRYSDQYFSGAIQESPAFSVPSNSTNATSTFNVEKFDRALKQVTDAVLENLTAVDSPYEYAKKFATAMANVNESDGKIYAAGECTWDLHTDGCIWCLRLCIKMLQPGKMGGRVLFPSCSVRYETYQFYQDGPLIFEPNNTHGPRPNPRPPTNMVPAPNTIKPGCQRKCGNLTVPYPFGIGLGSQCSMSSWYDINCNTSYHPPKPFLAHTKIEVLEISESHVIIGNQVAGGCYNSTEEKKFGYNVSMNLSNSPFTFSDTFNKFTAMGCDDVATISAIAPATYVGACVTLCTQKEDIKRGSCSGIGCCQTSIPKGLKAYSTNKTALTKKRPSNATSFGPCSYNFLAQVNSFTFEGLPDLSHPNFGSRVAQLVPVVLEWNVGNGSTCHQAQHNNSSVRYECQKNTKCTDKDLGSGTGGYTCSCLPGYEGNPYLSPGCTDIDECASADNPCSGICINTPGSYECSCPDGHHGDGRKDGTACSANNMDLGVKFALGLGSGIVFVIFLFGCYWFFQFIGRMREKSKRAKNFSHNGGLLLKHEAGSGDDTVEKTKIFTAPELDKATDNFNQSRILGQGGQGTVYKGMLADGRIVAIKKSKRVDDSQSQQFINEVVILSQINHKNVVKLLGCCLETEVPLLVYEFVPNGTLWQHIHDPNEDFHITWEMRLQIAAEAAGALAYLHSSLSAPIYHRDIKSSNFLLDDKYKVKISDFGISRSISIDHTHLTTDVKGTFGYLDPEYFHSYQFTEKSDVYSFGVVLVEMLTCKKPISPKNVDYRGLAGEFLVMMENSRLFEILEPQVIERAKQDELQAVSNLARRCLNISGKMRPTMKEVATVLDGIKSSSISHEVVQESLCCEIDTTAAAAAEIREAYLSSSSANTSILFSQDESSYMLR